ncbi:MAG: hypothetical protein JST89_04130 [Cyanobacteria bacterium SZAS-4]|nr:hypothetical protein [Cyanobacteria bacterium SZAS-4]
MLKLSSLFSKAAIISSALFVSALSPAFAVNREVKLAACADSPDAVASAGLATRNGKTVVSLTANFLGDAGCDIRPLKKAGVLARELYEQPTTFLFDFNGNKPRSSFTLFVIVDYFTNGGTLKLSKQVSFGDQNSIPLVRQNDGTYLATVTEKALVKHFIRPDDVISKFTLDYRNADNQDPNFISTIYVNSFQFLGKTLPIDTKTPAAGCNVFR